MASSHYSKSEKYIERKLVEHVKAKGGLCIKLLTDRFSGLPDRICLLPYGTVKFVEVKSKGQRPRKLQRIILAKLARLGFECHTIDNIEQIKEIC